MQHCCAADRGQPMQRQEQRQIRSLSLSLQMRLALDVLHMDTGRLRRRIRLELARNPALTCSDPELLPQAEDARAALIAQIGLLRLTVEQRRFARELVHCLDDRGLLVDPLAEIAAWLGTTHDMLNDLLPHLHQLEPPGVFARDIAECFRLQLRAKNRLDPWMDRLLDRLDLVAANDLSAIAAFLGTDHEDSREMVADIRNLSLAPFLGSAEPEGPPPELELTAEGVLRLGTTLKLVQHDGGENAEARISAQNLAAAVEGRAASLLRIGTAMVELQLPWLLGGGACRPLTMTALGAQLGMSKSTISRAVAGVAMRTPNGIVHLRDLLKTPVSPQNPDLDREAVAKTLRNIMDNWPAAPRMTDALLVKELAARGIRLSRRTVAKYRLELGSRPIDFRLLA
ncbi:RNA polymerase subunit sigma-54 [Sinirhodobacter populi]|uniref:RNA polymerase sigma-54 factor n=2 Tax=Paenirhodobacter populi TaxID=2306993 RepID=A0A443J9K5_9RHOB|nr:RNA polymerase subunit sigma-54 [Sinirhodobacter populi]RWR17174.1 RNA polymerase subunit sigma-54 [Sinirhodobacter populi]